MTNLISVTLFVLEAMLLFIPTFLVKAHTAYQYGAIHTINKLYYILTQ